MCERQPEGRDHLGYEARGTLRQLGVSRDCCMGLARWPELVTMQITRPIAVNGEFYCTYMEPLRSFMAPVRGWGATGACRVSGDSRATLNSSSVPPLPSRAPFFGRNPPPSVELGQRGGVWRTGSVHPLDERV